LSVELDRAALDGAAGVVITQGTDTIEETRYAQSVVPGDAPVVVTGAMRNPTLAGVDEASKPARRHPNCGKLSYARPRPVLFGDAIHAARYVRKVHSTSAAAFALPHAGPDRAWGRG
jgi:L-asparaginase